MFSARIGESMAAYQSPSKDLSFINGRLQQRHPFRAGAADAALGAPAFVLQNLDPNSVRRRPLWSRCAADACFGASSCHS